MSSVWSYEGRRCVVTGAASGMGAAVVEELVDLGAEVIGVDIKPTDAPVKDHVIADLSDRPSIEAAVARISEPVDALFNCAGLPTTAPPATIFRVNFVGLRHFTESLLPKVRDGGSVASVSSVAGLNFMAHMGEIGELLTITDYDATLGWCAAHPDFVADGYGPSKECIIMYTMQRSFPLITERGIRMNCLSPGPTDTPMMPHFEQSVGKDFMDSFPKPIGRNSRAEEQAYPLIFLNSDAASYITGHNLMTDGGFLGAMMTGQIDPSVLTPPQA